MRIDYANELRKIADDYLAADCQGPHEQTLRDAAEHLDRCHAMMIDGSDLMIESAEAIASLIQLLTEARMAYCNGYFAGWSPELVSRIDHALGVGK